MLSKGAREGLQLFFDGALIKTSTVPLYAKKISEVNNVTVLSNGFNLEGMQFKPDWSERNGTDWSRLHYTADRGTVLNGYFWLVETGYKSPQSPPFFINFFVWLSHPDGWRIGLTIFSSLTEPC